jgi:hypothetical protein
MPSCDLRTLMGLAARENAKTVRYRSIRPLIVDAIQVNGPTDFPTCNGALHASSGDWVLRDPHGNVRLCSDAYFRSNYAPMGGSQPLEQFRERASRGGC